MNLQDVRVIAYTYEADVHCPACTKQAARRMAIDHTHPWALGFSLRDEQGIEYDTVDREGNLIHPVFDVEEHPAHCCDCHEEL